MAFSADELRVLRRALSAVLYPAPLQDEDVRDALRLAEAVDEAAREAGRLRAFLLDDLARYREALPGSLGGYLELLQDALAAGYDPGADDLAALRALREVPAAEALLTRCQVIAEASVRARLARVSGAAATAVPGSRARLLALPGGRAAGDDPKPTPPAPAERPVPKPNEVFPPRRRPVPPPPPEERAAG
ncbi:MULTISPECIES: hypothetical protein [unclassified Streptomyces]|uniref:hypothetical protein n=1 Tax=unclassified Streptomyces TaxID=2593676 RepID=UPI001660622D|nr:MULTISPECIES: hypothetical protein [unclassified Streptomyces]